MESISMDALNLDKDNIFEYLFLMMHNKNTNMIGDKSEAIINDLYKYIKSLPLPNLDSVTFEVDDMVMHALAETSRHAFEKGFIEACRLHNTLHSF